MKQLFALVLFLAIAGATAVAQMHGPPPMTKSQFESAVTGSTVNLVVRVDGVARDTMHADLLEAITETSYKTSGTSVDLFYPQDTPVVMGSKVDVKPGAILFVYAVATGRDKADVKKLVVMTPYVTVK